MVQDMKTLENGWTFCPYSGTVYHFQHFPLAMANQIAEFRQSIFVLETINWTLADEQTVHFNKYFAIDMPSAIALAAKMEIEWQEVAEELVQIRPATREEQQLYLEVSRYFNGLMPQAISDEQAMSLQTTVLTRLWPFYTKGKKSHCRPRLPNPLYKDGWGEGLPKFDLCTRG